ncbi:transient receptor potential cation channel subfamily V member 1 isoform X1 [Pygocentrus nattereri]|uniref:Ion transport domain-containing protein n=1 Tax=Pygocentrus nattereri TaxID=42514 RepID=A0A3B4DQ79_PYGNA|nr:transient receptor potential cation channel subfamily V member 1 isoform X1 [Pygocentrus nattereri]XP_017570352.1 transient receptor potential cation channel subfamily V member 1 isoform X1 [Pygocentrus nattereri]
MSRPFSLEADDSTDEERAKAKAARKAYGKGCPERARGPMDTDFLEDHGEITCQVRFNLNFDKKIRGIENDPSQKEKDRFDIKRLFEAVSSGDVSKLEGLHEYLRKTNKKLTDTTYRPNGKTALLKALLNLKNGENETVEHLLDIAEKMGHLEELVNAAYTDCYYRGQTALHVAIERRSKRFAELLVQKGANVHAKACGSFFQPRDGTCFYFGELPLSLAACTNQKEIVDMLMNNKADVRESDSQGNTVLHALVMVADNSPENTDFVTSMYDYILITDAHMNPNQKKLEDFENNQRLTPIKLAAKTGKIGLFEHILHREFQQEQCRHLSRKFTEWAYGPVYASLYDLDSIDTYDNNSVLEIVVYGTEMPNRLEMLQIEPLNNLLEDKWNRFACRIFLFNFICYLIYLSIFTTLCHYHTHDKHIFPLEATKDYLCLAGGVIVLVASIYFFIKGLMDMKRKPPRLQTLLIDGYSDLLFFFQAVFFLLCVGLYVCKKKEYLAFLVVCLALSWINLLYFSRGSQHMGIYSVMIQRMILGDVLRFLLVYFVFLFGFSAAVVTLLYEDKSLDQSNKTVSGHGRSLFEDIPSEDCKKPTYKNISFTTLELFKFTIGMGDLEFTEQYEYKHVFYVLLISYIVLTYILLLNMLIAMMSKRVEKMSEETTNIWKLQRAITTLDLERSLGRCLKTKLRSGVDKVLGKKEKDVRRCLRVEEVNWNKWNRNLGIISEDPGDFIRFPPTPRPQRGQSWSGFLRDFSRRRPNTLASLEEQEMRPLASSPV